MVLEMGILVLEMVFYLHFELTEKNLVVAGRINRKEHKQERCEVYCMGKVAALQLSSLVLCV